MMKLGEVNTISLKDVSVLFKDWNYPWLYYQTHLKNTGDNLYGLLVFNGNTVIMMLISFLKNC